MKTDNYALRVFIVSMLVASLVAPAGAQSMNSPMPPPKELSFDKPVDIPVAPQIDYTGIGTIAGVVRNASGIPLASATVTARQLDGAGIRATISGSDGIYSFADLPSGMYRVTTDAIGATVAVTPPIQVTNGHATRFDLGGAPNLFVPTALAVAQPAPAALAKASATESNKFWNRWLSGQNGKPTNMDNQLHTQAEERAEKAKSMAAAAAPTSPAEPVKVASLGNAPIAAAFDKPTPDSPAPDPQAAAPAAPAAPAKPPLVLPEPLSAPDPPPPGVDNVTPFAYADFSWMNGNTRANPVLDTKFFTPEIRFDSYYMLDTNQPVDHTMGGSTEQFRSGEFQLEQISVGGDFHWDNVRGRILTMDGLFSTTTPRNDASGGVGQWNLADAYRYISEA